MATEAVLSNYRVGSVDWGWDIEFAMLIGQDAHGKDAVRHRM
jgi:hypothetical protein